MTAHRVRSTADPDPAAVPDGASSTGSPRRRDLDVGLGHDRDLGGPPLRHPGRRELLSVGQPRDHGARPAVHDRQPGRAIPHRQCIAFVGDGGFAMLMAEFDTACRYELPIKVVINNNTSLGQILWEQMVLGYPEYGVRFGEPARLRALGRGVRRLGHPGGQGGRPRGRSSRRRSATRARPRRRAPSTPTSRRCRRRCSTSRRRASSRRSSPASPARPRSLARCVETRSPSCGAMSLTVAEAHYRHRSPAANIRHGRFERSSGRPHRRSVRSITGVEIWLEHDRASFANRMMWLPVALTRSSAPGSPASCPARAAKTVLPVALGGRPRQQPAGPVPPPARHRAAARRVARWPATTPRWAADLRSPAVRPRRRHGPRCLDLPP